MENIKKSFSIRTKTISLVIISAILLAGFIYYISNRVIFREYLALENSEMLLETKRVDTIFNNNISELSLKLADWASWNDTYVFIKDKNAAYIESNLIINSFKALQVNAMIFVNDKGEIVYNKIINSDFNQEISSEELITKIKSNINLFQFTDLNKSFSGIISLKEGNLIVVAKPISKSNGDGPIAGTLIFGKFINRAFLDNIANIAQLSVDLYPYNSPTSTEDLLLAKQNLTKENKYFIYPLTEESIGGYLIVYDINGNPISIFKTTSGRDIYNQGKNTINFFVLLISIVAILFGIIIIFFTGFMVIFRIQRLNKELFDIAKTGDVSKRLKMDTNDEIGSVIISINNMFSQLFKDKEKEKINTEKLKAQAEELDKKIKELAGSSIEMENSKKAIINLLEDIENDKVQIEETVKVRTKELSEEKSRLISSINSLSFGFTVVSMDGNIILVNPALLKILNIEKVPATVSELAKFFEKFDLVGTYEECVRTQETIEINDVTSFNKYLKLFYAPIVNVNKIIDYVIIIEDITEAKLLERGKDEFFAVASHELRTPLTAIHGNVDMILDTYKEQIKNIDVKEMLTDINIASIRLINIVNSFLDVSRLEQGKIVTEIKEFELPELINKVIKNQKIIADKKKIYLTYNLPPVILSNILADQGHVEQILINLISNAIKFTDKGGITISTEEDKGFAIVRITDTGAGIDQRNQSLLFRKFQQAGEDIFVGDYSTSSGLGLYICKMLVNKMGGEVGIEKSEPGKGSTFYFTLPLAV